MNKPKCAVKGMVRPGAMCGAVIVGGVYCGHDGNCQHKIADLLSDERECCGTLPRTPHRATGAKYRGKFKPSNAGGNATERREGRVDHNVGRLTPGEE